MAEKKNLKPGMPVELVSDASEILEKLQELYAEHGIYLLSVAYFQSHDDTGDEHLLRVDFDASRGDGEYILVTENG